MFGRFATAAVFALTAGAASADEITLAKPLAGASLHEGGVDMTIYWVEAGAGAEVVAIYAPQLGEEAPSRLAMRLEEGDAVAFSLPGAPWTLYRFALDGGAVEVSATRLALTVAQGG